MTLMLQKKSLKFNEWMSLVELAVLVINKDLFWGGGVGGRLVMRILKSHP